MNSDYSLQALLRFLEFVSQKGLAKRNTAVAMRIAVSKILTELSPDEEADVRKVDVPLAARRFNNKNPNVLSPTSLGEYQRRTTRAIREFVKYLENPTSYSGLSKSNLSGKSEGARKEVQKRAEPGGGTGQSAPALGSQQGQSGGLPHAFPLRANFLAQIVLPRDLKAEEAKRLGAFISALVVDYEANEP